MNPRIVDWRGKRVWLLGASSGIGAALARALAQRGARVAISARRVEPLDALVETIPGAVAMPCDASSPSEMAHVLAGVQRRLGGLDVAIYAAGIWQPATAATMDAVAIDTTLDINLRGAMHFANLVVPVLRAQQSGAIGFISSVAGYRPLPQALLYGASKAGLSYFAGVLHVDLAREGIGVQLINPGFVDTPMTAKNRFRMPALIGSDEAARAIIAGYADGDFEIHFPKRFTRGLKALALLPDALYLPLVKRVSGGRRGR